MPKKNQSKFIINERDRAIFSYLYEVKVATSNQIMRDVFTNVSKTVFYRRVKKYIQTGIVKRIGHFDGDKQIISYSLSKNGLSKFILEKNDHFLIKRCLSEAVIHDLALNDIRHLFMSKKSVSNYLTENVLNSHGSMVADKMYEDYRRCGSDAFIELTMNNKKIFAAIEYEQTLKYTNRYIDLFGKYYSTYDIDAIFYIASDKRILTNVQKVEKMIRNQMRPKVFFALMSNLKNNPNCLTFTSTKENTMIKIS